MNNPDQLLEVAKTSNCAQTLHNLAESTHSAVRRAVARNMNTLSNTLEQLAHDPVLNVSFMATQHPKCNVKREFSNCLNPCVTCEKDERTMVCVNCSTLEDYYRN